MRTIRHPVTVKQLSPLPMDCKTVSIQGGLTDKEHVKVSRFIAKHPSIRLNIALTWSDKVLERTILPVDDLTFLRFYPTVQSLHVMVWELKTFSGIESLKDSLNILTLGETKARGLSLAFLRSTKQLKSLSIEKHTTDFQTVGELENLGELTIRSITLPDLDLVASLPKLQSLNVNLGGTKNLSALARAKNLKCLSLWMVRGLSDLSVISKIPSLQNIELNALTNVTKLPSLLKLGSLRSITLNTMKGITDLSPVADAPVLQELFVFSPTQLQPKHFKAFVGHRTLKSGIIELGSRSKNEQVRQLLGLPDCPRNKPYVKWG